MLRLCARVVLCRSWVYSRSLCQLSPKNQIEKVISSAQGPDGVLSPRLERFLQRFTQSVGKSEQYTCADVSRVLYVCTKMKHESSDVLKQALKQLDPVMLKRASVKDLSLCLYSLSIMHKKRWLLSEKTLRDRVAEIVVDQLLIKRRQDQFRAVDISQIIYALAIMRFGSDMLLRCLCRSPVLSEMEEFSARECATLIWSVMKFDLMDMPLLHRLSKRAMETSQQMKGSEISMVMWAWGCLGKDFRYYVADFLTKTFKDSEIAVQLKPQHYSNILLTLGRLRFQQQPVAVRILVRRLIAAMQTERIGEQSLANAIWALGRIQYRNKVDVDILVHYAVRPSILKELTPRGLCNILMGWATLNMTNETLVDTMAEEITEPARLSTFSNLELSILNWALGRLHLTRDSLINRLVSETTRTDKLAQFSEKQISAILHGWAMLRLNDEDSIHKIIREALSMRRMQRYRTFELANLIWSIGTLQVKHRKYYISLCDELGKQRRIANLTAWDAKQALEGFYQGAYLKPAVAYFFRAVYDHWLSHKKLHKMPEPDLQSICTTLKLLPFIEPVIIHQIEIELAKRKKPADIASQIDLS